MLKFGIALALWIALVLSASVPSSKINVNLINSLQSKSSSSNSDQVNIIVSFGDGTESALNSVTQQTYASRGEQATAVYNSLNAQATKSQQSALQFLRSRFSDLKIQSFWITNQIYVRGADWSVIEALAALEEVSAIDEEEIVTLLPFTVHDEPTVFAEWNIERIQAEDAWDVVNGDGGVVGIIDTGARVTHEALVDNYRAGTHSWYNPYTGTQTPADGHGHGTHVTGIAVGSHGIGVAPGVKWIACKGLQDNGAGGQAQLIACGQFMACPTNAAGENPDCSLAPHSVSNSWGGGSGQTWFDGVLNAWRSANIVPVFGIGNGGPICGSANVFSGVISVAATNSADLVANSGRGPLANGEQAPVVCAPGVGIRSAGITSDTSYSTMSGSSMATPHVAGLIALLKSAKPTESFYFIRSILANTTDPYPETGIDSCTGKPLEELPNTLYGYGRINALKAVLSIQ